MQEGLTRFPLVLHAPPPPSATEIPPPELMKDSYRALMIRARNILLQDRAPDDPTPPYYKYPPSLSPHPLMCLGKCVAGTIHEMRAGKGYRSEHPSWFDKPTDTTCPQCGIEPVRFQHAILTCPALGRQRDLLLREVTALGHGTAILTEPELIQALGDYISNMKTGFPPDMTPNLSPYPPPSPPLPT